MNKTRFRRPRLSLGVLAVLSFWLLGADSCQTQPPNFVEVTIFHTNDIHSQLRPPRGDDFQLGGLARMSTLLANLRAKRPTSVTLDAGDWSEGAWAFSIDTGANMLRFFKDMHFDAAVVGNHDYLVGPDRLVETVEEAQPGYPVLAANLDLSKYPGAERLRKYIGSTTVIERNGLKIGVIGLTCVDFEFSEFLKPVVASDVFKAATLASAEMRPNVDVLILLSHNKFVLNVELGRLVPGVDAVVSGHSHRKLATAYLVKNAGKDVPVVETGSWGRFVGELRLNVDAAQKRVAFKAYEIHPVDPKLPEAPGIRAKVDAEYEKLNRFYGSDVTEVVARSEAFLDSGDSHTANLGHLAAKGYRIASGADLALELLPFAGFPVPAGPVTIEALHDVLPHTMNLATGKEWTIKVWNAKAADLALIANLFYSGANTLPFGSTGFMASDNMEIVWEPRGVNGPIAKVKKIAIGGTPLDMNRRYTIALTDGFLLSIQIANDLMKIGLDMSQIYDTGIEGWRAIVDYGKNVKILTQDGLLEGARAWTSVADLAIDRSNLAHLPGKIVARIVNDGLLPSEGGVLRCSTGVANDPRLYETEEEVFTPAVEGAIAALDPGKDFVLELSWNPTPGSWPVQCEIIADRDGYAGNNLATTVFHVPGSN